MHYAETTYKNLYWENYHFDLNILFFCNKLNLYCIEISRIMYLETQTVASIPTPGMVCVVLMFNHRIKNLGNFCY